MDTETTNALLTYLISPAGQMAFVMVIAEIAKNAGLPAKYVPILDIVLGAAMGALVYTLMQGMTILEGLVLGIGIGLASCGTFSGVKNVIEKGGN